MKTSTPFHLADASTLLAHARDKKLISDADVGAVQERLVDLVDRGLLGAIDPLATEVVSDYGEFRDLILSLFQMIKMRKS